MVESHFDDKQEVHCSAADNITPNNSGSPLHRDPSFSCWHEDGTTHPDYCLKNSEEVIENSHSQLPLLRQDKIENKGAVDAICNNRFQNGSTYLNGGNAMDHETNIHNRRDDTEKYVAFDIERTSSEDVRSLSSDGDHEKLPSKAKSPLSAADVLKILFFILVWYTFSTFLTLYNKTLLGDDMGKFPAPLLMNTVHFAMQAVLSNAITWYWSYRFQPTAAMSWKDYFLRVVPTALGTALDINLSNESLVFISVTFATMCKSASPIFLLLFAFAFRLESPSIKLLGIITVISAGILLTVSRETEFEFWGFLFVMLAAVMSGFRWSMTQILLQKEAYGLKNPITLMSYVTPVMAIATALLSLLLDPWNGFNKSSYFDNSWHIARSSFLMLFGGALAFFMVLTEYVLVSVTSAVTVNIAGVVKEAVTIVVAVFYFHDEFTWLKGVGLFTIMVGVSLFNWYKYQKLQKSHTSEDDLESPTRNVAAKYVILEEMDDGDDGT